MIRSIFYAMSVAGFAVPLAAQAQTADFEAGDALIGEARAFADITVGQASGAQKSVYLGRNQDGGVAVKALGLGAPMAQIVAGNDQVVLVIWLRPADKAPTRDDGALAASLGRSLLIYDEASRGKVMWEIARRGGTMQYRKVDGRPAAWQSWK
ncbi:hypothetical protein [Sphingomonas koreensis]